MKLLVAPHDLEIGGSQINAIDLAAGAAAAGHEVVVYGRPGPLVDYVDSRGLEFIASRPLKYRPAPSRIMQLRELARSRELDLIHAYEWPPCLDAYFGAHLRDEVPLLCTVLSMSVPRFLPPSVPVVMGTEALGREARARQRGPVWVLEPPIDTEADSPEIDGAPLRAQLGLEGGGPLLVTVSRLSLELKLDALTEAIDAADRLADRTGLRLLIVGDGPAGGVLKARGAEVNRRHGREVVVFAGALADPRQAYAAADLVLGMGSSSLRAMAMRKPVVVQGERGFSKVFEPTALPYFLEHGFWGLGEGEPGDERLAAQIGALLGDRWRLSALASYGHKTVLERFSLERAVGRQLEIYEELTGERGRSPRREAPAVAARALRLEIENHDPVRKWARERSEAARLREVAA
jgi:glycosyltransferase involved in cell wall biosynthesis